MCKIVEPLFYVLSRFVVFSSDLLLFLSFLNRFGAFMRVLEVYFVVTLKCDQDRTERKAAAATIVVAETEHACIRTTTVIASAYEERIARVRKVRVNAVPRTTA